MASLFAQAQDCTRDSLLIYVKSPTGASNFKFKQSFSVQMYDGNLLTCIPAKINYDDIGDWFYKIDAQNATVIDSVFVANDPNYYERNEILLLAQAPDGDGYILAKLLQSKNNKSWLRINRIDDALNVQAHSDAPKVIIDNSSIDKLIGIELEGEQIVLSYVSELYTPVVTRVGLNGTVHSSVTFFDLFQIRYVTHGFAVYNESPREYAIYDWYCDGNDTCLVYHVIDSLLTLKESIVMERHEGDIYYVCPGSQQQTGGLFRQVHILPLDDGSFVEAFQYERHSVTRNGVCLLKYDKTTHECLANAQFESWPIYLLEGRFGYPIGMERAPDGNIYLSYRTNNNIAGENPTTKGWIGIAKLDRDLNVIWQRYCLGGWTTATGYKHYYCDMSPTDDGFVVYGKIEKEGQYINHFHCIVHDGDPYGTPEVEAFIRPYMFYPNPVQNELRLQYSPDVTPKQIEFYDLQGCLVRTQNKDLESINMEGLPAGTYTMRVVLENGKVYSDKVVKE